MLLLIPLLLALVPPVELPAPFTEHHQTAETLLYLIGFGLLLPLSTWLAIRLASRRGPAAEDVAGWLLGTLALAIVVVKIAVDLGAERLFATAVLGAVWLVIACLIATRPGRPAVPGRILWIGTLVAVAGALACLTSIDTLSWPAFMGSLAVGVGLLVAIASGRMPAWPAWLRVTTDLAVFALVWLAVPDTMIVYPEAALTDGVAAFDTEVIQFHQNLFLGAASQVLDGHGVLAGTVSQYGVASIYLIAAFFELFPIGHGTLGLLDGLLTGLCFGAGYLTMRLAGSPRMVAAATLVVAVTVLAWGSHYPEGALLQHGAIRFGLPMGLIPLAVASWRWPTRYRIFRLGALAVVGLSSIWALEAFLYVAITWGGIICVELTWASPGSRIRTLIRQVGLASASVVAFHLAFALLTLAGFGSLPDWGSYLTYLREFLGGDIGDLTYDFVPFSPALGLGFAYLVSTAGVVALALRPGAGERRATLVALAGLTAYGIVLFSYFDNRSLGHILSYVSLPALLLGGIWLGLANEKTSGFGPFARRVLGLAAVAGAALLIGVAWPTAKDRATDSVLAVALPGGPKLADRFHRLKYLPPLVPGAAQGERMLERYFPGEDSVPVVVKPDLDVNILVRAGRSNALGITDAKEASWVPGPHLDEVADRVNALEPGQLMLLDTQALDAWKTLRLDPAAGDFEISQSAKVALIQVAALREIAARFRFEPVATDPAGFSVVRLVPVG